MLYIAKRRIPSKDCYYTDEVMEILGVSRGTLIKLRKAGILRPLQLNGCIRYPNIQINELLQHGPKAIKEGYEKE